MLKKTIVLSLGGSLIVPGKVDVKFLKKFRQAILAFVKKGNRVIIVCGGGNICRQYNQAATEINPAVTPVDLDWLGIAATKFNAELVRSVFGNYAYEKVIVNPTLRVKTNKNILIGSGWKPGCSSDKDAVLMAKSYGAKLVINLSNIKYVYTADPRKVKAAKPIKHMSWDDLLHLTGRKWRPGAHVPFDPEASKLAKKLSLQVVVCLGTDLKNLQAIMAGKPITGTVIS